MALVVGENTYATVAEADTYNGLRGRTDWVSLNEATKEQYLITAMDKIEVKKYHSTKYLQTQSLQFPRLDNFSWDTESEVPAQIEEAQIEEAYAVYAGTNNQAKKDLQNGISKHKINDTEVEYVESIVKSQFGKYNFNSNLAKEKLSYYLQKQAYCL